MTSPITDEQLNEILDECEGETGEKVVGKQTLYLLASELIAARESLSDIAKQKLSDEIDGETYRNSDFEGAYHTCVERARRALSGNRSGN